MTTESHLCQCRRHLECPHCVHVGRDDRDTLVDALGVQESELAVEVNLEIEGEINTPHPNFVAFRRYSMLV